MYDSTETWRVLPSAVTDGGGGGAGGAGGGHKSSEVNPCERNVKAALPNV